MALNHSVSPHKEPYEIMPVKEEDAALKSVRRRTQASVRAVDIFHQVWSFNRVHEPKRAA